MRRSGQRTRSSSVGFMAEVSPPLLDQGDLLPDGLLPPAIEAAIRSFIDGTD